MKRPPGVPQAPRPSSSREPARPTAGASGSTAPRSTTPGSTAPGTRGSAAAATDRAEPARPATAPTASEPDATTEPITLPAATGTTPPHGARPSAAPRTPGVFARLTRRRANATGAAAAGATAPAAETAAPLTARAARARLRAARRARKQYERSEVRRFTSRSRRKRNLWIAAGATVVTLVAFVLVGVYSPLMALRTIEITGTQRIQPEDLVAALDGQLGTPLPLVDFDEVKRELSEFSLIRSYVTESRPPDTLVVRIVEREPVGAIASAAGFDLVDAAGVVITSGAERPAGYPVIDAAGGASGAGFPAAVAVVAALPEGIRSQLDTVTAATKDDVTLTLTEGARVVWGNSERADYKAVVLAALLVSHPVGSVTEYDVSSPDSAVVR